MAIQERQIDSLNLSEKRMLILVGAKLRETNRIDSAIKIQDFIRSKIGKWQGSKEIKKWREAR